MQPQLEKNVNNDKKEEREKEMDPYERKRTNWGKSVCWMCGGQTDGNAKRAKSRIVIGVKAGFFLLTIAPFSFLSVFLFVFWGKKCLDSSDPFQGKGLRISICTGIMVPTTPSLSNTFLVHSTTGSSSSFRCGLRMKFTSARLSTFSMTPPSFIIHHSSFCL
jgi:hypothetical protein